MALSQSTKDILIVSMANRSAANELSSAVDANAPKVAADVAAIGTQTPAVDQTTTNTNIAAIQAKVDAILAALKAAGLML